VLPTEARAVSNFGVLPGDSVADVLAHVRGAVDDARVEMGRASYALIEKTIRSIVTATLESKQPPMPTTFISAGPGVPPCMSPISQAVVAGSHCYISGQLAVDADGVFRAGTTKEEAMLAFQNLFAVAEAAGFSREEIVYVDIAFIDLGDLSAVNQIWSELFPEGRRPARTVHQAAALPCGGRVKVQAIAVRDDSRRA
jgi:2-iminobutanoate/2-iminopropanoate deaminase